MLYVWIKCEVYRCNKKHKRLLEQNDCLQIILLFYNYY